MALADILFTRALDRLTATNKASRILEAKGPLLRAEVERRINLRIQSDKDAPVSPNYLDQLINPPRSSSDALGETQGGTATTLPASRTDGPVESQRQLQQQQETNVGLVGTENRFLMRGDNLSERNRMRAAQDEIDSTLGNGGEIDSARADYLGDNLGVTIPPADPRPRLEVSDTGFQFKPEFLSARAAEHAADTTNTKNIVRPFMAKLDSGITFGDMIDDSWEVFRYYPSLKNIQVKPLGFFDGWGGTRGGYASESRTMFLPRYIGNNPEHLEEVRSTIVHEVQHYIQDVEGWARGGNVQEFENLFKGDYKDFSSRRQAIQGKYNDVIDRVGKIPEVERFNRLVDEGLKLPKEARSPDNSDLKFSVNHARTEALQTLGFIPSVAKSRFLAMTYEEMSDTFKKSLKRTKSNEGFIRPKGYAREVADQLAQILALRKSLGQYTGVQEAIRLAGKIKKLDGISAMSYEGYKNLFGEAEARQAQDRLNMPDDVRATTPQDISSINPDSTIVRRQNQELKGNIVPGASFENGHIVFHGGPVSAIDKFMLEYIGTGEGNVARGWGFYFADNRVVAEVYRDARQAENIQPGLKNEAGLFMVDLKATKDKDFLDLDTNLLDQSERIRKSLASILSNPRTSRALNETGDSIVKELENIFYDLTERGMSISDITLFNSKGQKVLRDALRYTLDTSPTDQPWITKKKFASLVLKEIGIPGSMYLDNLSRSKKNKSNNYVIWDEDIIEQLAVQPYSWQDRGDLSLDS